MSIRTVIVEDEPLARERLRNLLEKDPDIQVVSECGDGRSAVEAVKQHRPDLLFLDIQLPERDGFEVLADLDGEKLPTIVFVTAYDQFAVKAFEVHAIDYLLKPFDIDRFEQALHRAKEQVSRDRPVRDNQSLLELLGTIRAEAAGPKRLAIKTSGRLLFVRTDQIDCVEAADNYVNVRTANEAHLVRDTLTSFEGRLPAEDFVRISRSCIVNLDRIKELQPLFHGEYAVILMDGSRLTLSRGYRSNLNRLRGSAK